jgi:hypothetical protein
MPADTRTLANVPLKTGLGKAHTGNALNVNQETITSAFINSVQNIWSQEIPTTPPTTTDGVVSRELTLELERIVGFKAYRIKIPSGQLTKVLGQINPLTGLGFVADEFVGHVITDSFGVGYAPVFKDSGGTQLELASSSNWNFDPFAGIITQENENFPLDGGTLTCRIYVGKFLNDTLADFDNVVISGGGVPQSVLDDLQSQIYSLSGDVALLEQQFDGGYATLTQLVQVSGALDGDITTNTSDIAALQSDLTTLQDDVASIAIITGAITQSQFDGLQSQVNTISSSFDTHVIDFNNEQSQNANDHLSFQNQIDALESNVASLSASSQGSGSSIASISASIDAQVSNLQSQIDSNDLDISTLQSDVSSLALSGGAVLPSEITDLQSQINSITANVASNDSNISDIQLINNTQTSDLITFGNSVTQLSNDVDVVEADVATNFSLIQQLSGQQVDLEGNSIIQSLSAAIDSNTSDISTNTSDISTLQADVASITTISGAVVQSDISNLQSQIDAISGDITTISQDISGIQSDVSDLGVANASQDNAISQLQTDLGDKLDVSTFAALSGQGEGGGEGEPKFKIDGVDGSSGYFTDKVFPGANVSFTEVISAGEKSLFINSIMEANGIYGQKEIPINDDNVRITYGQTLSGAGTPLISLEIPTDEEFLQIAGIYNSDTTGFDVKLSSPVRATGYKVNWTLNTSVQFDLSSVGQSFIPSQDITYDLGTPEKRWRDLYLSESTIYIGSETISVVESVSGGASQLAFGGNEIFVADEDGSIPLAALPTEIQSGLSFQDTINPITSNLPNVSGYGIGSFFIAISGGTLTDNISASFEVSEGDWAINEGDTWKKMPFKLPVRGITSIQIKEGAIQSDNILPGAVINSKIANDSIGISKLQNEVFNVDNFSTTENNINMVLRPDGDGGTEWGFVNANVASLDGRIDTNESDILALQAEMDTKLDASLSGSGSGGVDTSLVLAISSNLQAQIDTKADSIGGIFTTTTDISSSSYTITSGDVSKILFFTHEASDVILNLPDNLENPLSLTIVKDNPSVYGVILTTTGTSILKAKGGGVSVVDANDGATIIHKGSGVWYAFGDLI